MDELLEDGGVGGEGTR